MPIVYLAFMADNAEQIVFIKDLRTNITEFGKFVTRRYNTRKKIFFNLRRCCSGRPVIALHPNGGIQRHIERGWEPDGYFDFPCRGLVVCFVLKSLRKRIGPWVSLGYKIQSFTLNWKLSTGGSFLMLSRLLASYVEPIKWELNSRSKHIWLTWVALPHLLQW